MLLRGRWCGRKSHHPPGPLLAGSALGRVRLEDGLGDPDRKEDVERVDGLRHEFLWDDRRSRLRRLAVCRCQACRVRVVLHEDPLTLNAGVRLQRSAGNHFVRRAVFRSHSDESLETKRVHLRTSNPSNDRLAEGGFSSRMKRRRGRRGERTVARRVSRLVAFVMLFLLAVLTGMLVPPSWVVTR